MYVPPLPSHLDCLGERVLRRRTDIHVALVHADGPCDELCVLIFLLDLLPDGARSSVRSSLRSLASRLPLGLTRQPKSCLVLGDGLERLTGKLATCHGPWKLHWCAGSCHDLLPLSSFQYNQSV